MLLSLAIMLGGLAASWGWTFADAPSPAVLASSQIVKVSGRTEDAGRLEGEGPPDHAAETARQSPAPPEKPLPRALARQALAFTVHVRAGVMYGAGAVLDAQGHVVTCRHVIDGAERITVGFADGMVYDARLIDTDEELDLALLSIGPTVRPSVLPASIVSVEPGDELFAIGAPRNMPFSLSRGMASFAGRPFGRTFFLQSDLPMNGGSSGGPVLNDRGEVVAIASFVLRDSEGIAFALPIDYVYRRFAAALDASAAAIQGAGAFEGWLTARRRAGGHSAERR